VIKGYTALVSSRAYGAADWARGCGTPITPPYRRQKPDRIACRVICPFRAHLDRGRGGVRPAERWRGTQVCSRGCIIEQVHADLKNSALAHLPSGTFTANAAWLVLAVLAFNLTRAAAALSGPQLATATTGTIRRTLIVVPARIASSARRVVLHLPRAWPWQQAWTLLLRRACAPPGQGAT
jgi:hypothetical protein